TVFLVRTVSKAEGAEEAGISAVPSPHVRTTTPPAANTAAEAKSATTPQTNDRGRRGRFKARANARRRFAATSSSLGARLRQADAISSKRRASSASRGAIRSDDFEGVFIFEPPRPTPHSQSRDRPR